MTPHQSSAIINGQNAIVMEKVDVALSEGLNPVDILNTGMVEVGRRFEQGEAFVPEMLLSRYCGSFRTADHNDVKHEDDN